MLFVWHDSTQMAKRIVPTKAERVRRVELRKLAQRRLDDLDMVIGLLRKIDKGAFPLRALNRHIKVLQALALKIQATSRWS